MVLMGSDRTAMQKTVLGLVSDLEFVAPMKAHYMTQYMAAVKQLVYLARKHFSNSEVRALCANVPEALKVLDEEENHHA